MKQGIWTSSLPLFPGAPPSSGRAHSSELTAEPPDDLVELSDHRGPLETFWSQIANRPGGTSIEAFLSVAARSLGTLTWEWLKKAFPETAEDEHHAVFALMLMLREVSPLSYSHSNRVAELAVALGEELELTEEEQEALICSAQLKDVGQVALGLASMTVEQRDRLASDIQLSGITLSSAGTLHDIGKVYVPPGILSKPGPLTLEEREIMQLHPVVGEFLLSPVPSLHSILPAVRGHHERWDGLGYPDETGAQDIPLMARILCLADSFDAMTGERPYRKALSPGDAVGEILENSGSQFDPELVEFFVRRVARAY